TAGAVKNAEAYLDDTFLVLNGDNILTNMDLHDMLAFHRDKKAKATISLTRVDDPSSFGVVETNENQLVSRFIEKPPRGEATSNWINAGGYILELEVLKQIPPGQHYMFEKGLFPHLLETGQPVYGYTYKGYWLDMGTPQKYFTFNMDLLLSKTKSPLFQEFKSNSIYFVGDSDVNPTTKITGPVIIDRGCKIGAGVCITGPAVIGKDCIIEEGASLERVILWDKVKVGRHSQLKTCIISSDTVIEDNKNIQNIVITLSNTLPLFA
ncbi:MAG: hypothetical protein A2Y89_06970, partial [Chloroflexi bacterium RBG_13_51_18]